MSETLRWWGLSHTGHVRKNNEDAFLGLTFDAANVAYLGKYGEASIRTSDAIFAVSDGMGGANAGEFASRIAVEKITKMLPPVFKQRAVGIESGFTDILTELYHETHRALTFLGGSYAECAGMGATLSLAWFTPGWMYFAHIGDSRIYYCPADGGPTRQITHDDTHVGWLFRNGKLNEREARNHPHRNSLQRALGAGHQFVDPQTGSVGTEPGDRFLLCTDGLSDGLFDAQIAELMASTEANPAEKLVEESLARSGRDNTTALLVEVV